MTDLTENTNIPPISDTVKAALKAHKQLNEAVSKAAAFRKEIEKTGATAAAAPATTPLGATATASSLLESCNHEIAVLQEYAEKMKQHQTDLSTLWDKVDELETVLEVLKVARAACADAQTACQDQWGAFMKRLDSNREAAERSVAAHDLSQVTTNTNNRICRNGEKTLQSLRERTESLHSRCENACNLLLDQTVEEAQKAKAHGAANLESGQVVPIDHNLQELRCKADHAKRICSGAEKAWEETEPKMRDYTVRLAAPQGQQAAEDRNAPTQSSSTDQAAAERATPAVSNKRQREVDIATTTPSATRRVPDVAPPSQGSGPATVSEDVPIVRDEERSPSPAAPVQRGAESASVSSVAASDESMPPGAASSANDDAHDKQIFANVVLAELHKTIGATLGTEVRKMVKEEVEKYAAAVPITASHADDDGSQPPAASHHEPTATPVPPAQPDVAPPSQGSGPATVSEDISIVRGEDERPPLPAAPQQATAFPEAEKADSTAVSSESTPLGAPANRPSAREAASVKDAPHIKAKGKNAKNVAAAAPSIAPPDAAAVPQVSYASVVLRDRGRSGASAAGQAATIVQAAAPGASNDAGGSAPRNRRGEAGPNPRPKKKTTNPPKGSAAAKTAPVPNPTNVNKNKPPKKETPKSSTKAYRTVGNRGNAVPAGSTKQRSDRTAAAGAPPAKHTPEATERRGGSQLPEATGAEVPPTDTPDEGDPQRVAVVDPTEAHPAPPSALKTQEPGDTTDGSACLAEDESPADAGADEARGPHADQGDGDAGGDLLPPPAAPHRRAGAQAPDAPKTPANKKDTKNGAENSKQRRKDEAADNNLVDETIKANNSEAGNAKKKGAVDPVDAAVRAGVAREQLVAESEALAEELLATLQRLIASRVDWSPVVLDVGALNTTLLRTADVCEELRMSSGAGDPERALLLQTRLGALSVPLSLSLSFRAPHPSANELWKVMGVTLVNGCSKMLDLALYAAALSATLLCRHHGLGSDPAMEFGYHITLQLRTRPSANGEVMDFFMESKLKENVEKLKEYQTSETSSAARESVTKARRSIVRSAECTKVLPLQPARKSKPETPYLKLLKDAVLRHFETAEGAKMLVSVLPEGCASARVD